MIDPATAAANWVSGMQGAATKMTAGINAVTTAPGALAARQAAVWAQNTQAAQSKFAKNVGAVSLEEWKQAAITKGVGRVAGGATAAQSKMANAMQQILPQIDSIVKSLPPRGTTEQNIQRAVAYMNKAHQITYTP